MDKERGVWGSEEVLVLKTTGYHLPAYQGKGIKINKPQAMIWEAFSWEQRGNIPNEIWAFFSLFGKLKARLKGKGCKSRLLYLEYVLLYM